MNNSKIISTLQGMSLCPLIAVVLAIIEMRAPEAPFALLNLMHTPWMWLVLAAFTLFFFLSNKKEDDGQRMPSSFLNLGYSIAGIYLTLIVLIGHMLNYEFFGSTVTPGAWLGICSIVMSGQAFLTLLILWAIPHAKVSIT